MVDRIGDRMDRREIDIDVDSGPVDDPVGAGRPDSDESGGFRSRSAPDRMFAVHLDLERRDGAAVVERRGGRFDRAAAGAGDGKTFPAGLEFEIDLRFVRRSRAGRCSRKPATVTRPFRAATFSRKIRYTSDGVISLPVASASACTAFATSGCIPFGTEIP